MPARQLARPSHRGRRHPTVAGNIEVHVAGAVVKPGWSNCRQEAGFTKRLPRPAEPRGRRTRTGSIWLPCWRTARRSRCGARRTGCGSRPDGKHACRSVPAAGGTAPAGGGKINLNTAGVEELGTLPRVGPVLAQRIVDWRRQHGRFKTVQELDAVDGIGPKLLEALLPLVEV